MGQQMSPGVQVNEIDLSIVVPQLGNATAAFAGVFTKGPSDKFLLITNGEDLINYYGKPTNANYNDWYQAYNFLQYANKLLVSRAVDANGTFTKISNEVKVVNEIGKVEIKDAPTVLAPGSVVKFAADAEDEYKIASIEAPVEAVAQVDTITVTSALNENDTISVTVNGLVGTFTAPAGGSTKDEAAAGLAADIEADVNGTSATSTGAAVTVTARVPGSENVFTAITGNLSTVTSVTANVPGESYELVFDAETDFSAIAATEIFVKDSAINAIAVAPVGATYDGSGAVVTPASPIKNGDEVKAEAIFVPNDASYEIAEMSIPVYSDEKLKFIAKSSGSLMNKIEIAIARESDFASGKTEAFDGLGLNDFFESKPSEANSEIALLIREKGTVTGTYIVSMIPGNKDFRNKSNYIEDIINKYDVLLYVKDNTTITTLPQSRLAKIVNTVGGVDSLIIDQKPLRTTNGTDGVVNAGDIMFALGNVSDNTIFGNKEEVDVDIVIANEVARVACGTLALERADCIAFIGSKFEDVVGLQSAKIVENLVADVMNGDLNNAGTANSYCAYFGNYKQQYDKYNDKMRWISVAGDVAGLRADTNTKLNSWWASAGLDRGQIKNAQKIAFNPNGGQRDLLYKSKVNPIVSFPGQGNAIVWGQKTLQSKPSAFDRINVRGLFNTLERAISRMAKYYLFEFNDGFTRNRFVGTIKPFMDGVKAGRGCYDYYIRCDETNNTPAVIDSNNFVADIAVKPTRVAEFVTLNFLAVGTGVSFSEIFV